ncbi:disulfide bond formation protein B [Candidatus Nomurabacteria bacterium]|nr:disulfide bond formation protein B [Candidatus Nomurabacteria bacterium]
MYLLSNLNFSLAAGGLVLLVLMVGLYVDYFYYRSRYFNQWLRKFAWPIIIVTTFGGVAVSLTYSEYFGFVPCSLCWLQRIALYPQIILVAIAFRIKENVFFPLYTIALSLFGFGVATYQYIYQLIPTEALHNGALPCLVDGSSDCATKVIDEFGFVTFPLLSAIVFAFLIVMYLNLRRSN